MATPGSETDFVLRQTMRDFISGCHILHHKGVLDAYGHLSVRHPHKPNHFFMSRDIAPAVISSPDDLIEYYVEDAEPVHVGARKGYSERYIHSELLKRFPDVNATIHSHSTAVVPYTINGVPLRAVYHMAGFLGCGCPVYDTSNHMLSGDKHSLLVSNTHLGGNLAACFGEQDQQPSQSVVLMRGHGFTTQGQSIKDAVLRAIYTQQNALIQTAALLTHAAYSSTATLGAQGCKEVVPGDIGGVKYLTAKEAEDTAVMTVATAERPWRLWLREVEATGLYVNSA